MRRYVAVGVAAAVLAMSLSTELSAQRGAREVGARGGFHGVMPAIPHAPVARGRGFTAPRFEPERPVTSVPYVRDGHWYGHAAVDDARFRLARPFERGRFALTGPGHLYTVTRFDLGARRIWLPGGLFEIADWDWPVTAPWCWTCDQFVVYPDPDHPGWYLIYDARMGEYVHAQFLGA
jgi:hypothetical protein